MKKILIEGPDCSGKSTLVDRLKNSLVWDAKHLHHQAGDQFSRYLREYALADKLIFDRGHISEMVYGQLWRGGRPFNKKEYQILNDLIKEKFILVYVCSKIDVLEKRYQERNYAQQIKLSELKKSKKLFDQELANFEPIKYYSHNYQELDELIVKIEKELK